MRIFKTRHFEKFAKSSELSDVALAQAAAEVVAGLIDAKLGGNLVKKRVAVGSKGKSGGLRTILVHKHIEEQIIFLYGFAKKEKDNISSKELVALRLLDKLYSQMTNKQIETAINEQQLTEVPANDEHNG
ncbi:MAG: type II toxin-antitoxin system RelE/ParE family toxin [Terriglobales bacterium]